DFWTGNTYGSFFEPAHSDSNINLLGYTFAFGNGITASVAIEDPSTGSARGRNGAFSYDKLAVGDALGSSTYYGGVKYPDLVANVNITQAWGSAQIMGALHNNYGSAKSFKDALVPATVYGVDKDKWGYAIGAGVTVNLPMLGAGDVASLQAVYSKGATDYAAAGYSSWNNDFFVVGTTIEQSTAWSVGAGLTHNWTKTVSTAVEASYLKYDAANLDADYSQIDVQGNVVWAPVSGLTIGAEVEYRKVDFTSATTAAQGVKDGDAVVGLLRVQRKF
ncbi:MAG: hypothetical protein GX458_10885, partial [Phyllobacteriaceae bacterium]|nr:hypothetical protein [Phyllobacteriaceae bacterium]